MEYCNLGVMKFRIFSQRFCFEILRGIIYSHKLNLLQWRWNTIIVQLKQFVLEHIIVPWIHVVSLCNNYFQCLLKLSTTVLYFAIWPVKIWYLLHWNFSFSFIFYYTCKNMIVYIIHININYIKGLYNFTLIHFIL